MDRRRENSVIVSRRWKSKAGTGIYMATEILCSAANVPRSSAFAAAAADTSAKLSVLATSVLTIYDGTIGTSDYRAFKERSYPTRQHPTSLQSSLPPEQWDCLIIEEKEATSGMAHDPSEVSNFAPTRANPRFLCSLIAFAPQASSIMPFRATEDVADDQDSVRRPNNKLNERKNREQEYERAKGEHHSPQ